MMGMRKARQTELLAFRSDAGNAAACAWQWRFRLGHGGPGGLPAQARKKGRLN